jgi:hypothetical protein
MRLLTPIGAEDEQPGPDRGSAETAEVSGCGGASEPTASDTVTRLGRSASLRQLTGVSFSDMW